ncbi:hypothetical protein BCR36DRAFT_355124 [Piromyces finnis]|uniref:B box-type domain-containing protein n=1 Tax=Piromyces finnis TaxID=1754191 RepID=A0A1Y1V6C3_9FUNG|nr:hypothetical protein BCR36DRAFT_355124 [Piromyces finnis]|eukprot:ORX48180.1 hypothetical protein BCR36DRAFT_355124 [Piromyces finnis]
MATTEKVQLNYSSPQYSYLEYLLQLGLKASTVEIVNAFVVSNPHLSVQFDRRCKDILTLNSWVDSSNLVGKNTEENIFKEGFKFSSSESGMKFSVGQIKQSSSKDDHDNIKKILLCKIGVGRAYATTKENLASSELPEGYDSFYIMKDGENLDRKDDENEYYHEYYITESAQILPQYLVYYKYDPAIEKKSREKPICDNCEVAEAKVYCASDSANLCKECDLALHKSKLASRHIRTPIGKGGDIYGFCSQHKDKMIEFFCSQCHIPVCVYCKMVGHHSSGEAAKHKLVSVAEAYQTVCQESSIPDSILESRRTEIINQITLIKSQSKEVDKLNSQLERQIQEIAKKALNELKKITDSKLNILLGDELELRRQLGEIRNAENFLEYQQDGDATHFLFSWSRHQKMLDELHEFKFFRNKIDVSLDTRVSGSIDILSDQVIHIPESDNKKMIKTRTSEKINKSNSYYNKTSLSNKQISSVAIGNTGNAVPSKSQESKHIKTSDFFSEALGALDDINISQDDYDGFDNKDNLFID